MHRSNVSHPWRRGNRTGTALQDPIASTRSDRFAVYLDTLSRAERQRIELAERAFVWRAGSTTSPQQSTARDYAKGMLGVQENGLARYRGFVA